MADIVELVLGNAAHGGFCVAHMEYEGNVRVVFVRFGLPGERVRVRITHRTQKLWYGDVIDVLENPSPYRRMNTWKESRVHHVGGADLAHVVPFHQLQWKTNVLLDTLRRVGSKKLVAHLEENGISPRVHSCAEYVESKGYEDGWHTRSRIEVHSMGEGRFGMYKDGSRELIALSSMPLAVRAIEDIHFFDGRWAHIPRGERVRLVHSSTGQMRIVVGDNIYDAHGNVVYSPYVNEKVSYENNEVNFRVHAQGFWQVHRLAPASLVRMVMDICAIESGDTVLDIYSGAGLFTRFMGEKVGKTGNVFAYEGSKQAVKDARFNTKHMPWVRNSFARINDKKMRSIVESTNASTIVVDPPRKGLGVATAECLAASSAYNIVLISCDPASMARDVDVMVKAGKSVVHMKGLDIFPNTHHVECVVLMSKTNT